MSPSFLRIYSATQSDDIPLWMDEAWKQDWSVDQMISALVERGIRFTLGRGDRREWFEIRMNHPWPGEHGVILVFRAVAQCICWLVRKDALRNGCPDLFRDGVSSEFVLGSAPSPRSQWVWPRHEKAALLGQIMFAADDLRLRVA